jgi:hypothetical protein
MLLVEDDEENGNLSGEVMRLDPFWLDDGLLLIEEE